MADYAAITIDGVMPYLTKITADPSSGALSLDETTSISAHFNEVVTLTGTVNFVLSSNSRTYQISSVADGLDENDNPVSQGSEVYTVLAGDLEASDLSISSINISGGGKITDAAGNEVAWFSNDGSENFTTITIEDNITTANYLQVVDLDGDSDEDIVITSAADDDVIWYQNDGSENFTKIMIDNKKLYHPGKIEIKNLRNVYNWPDNLVSFSNKFKNIENEIRSFLRKKMYNNKNVLKKNNEGKKIVKKLFEKVSKKPKKFLTLEKLKDGKHRAQFLIKELIDIKEEFKEYEDYALFDLLNLKKY